MEERLSYFRQLAFILGTVSLVVGFLLVTTLVTVSVQERVGEMAVMRALGISRPHIAQQVMLEGLAISVLGTMLGLGLGLVTAEYLNGILRSFPGLPAAIDFFVFEPRAAWQSFGLLVATAVAAGTRWRFVPKADWYGNATLTPETATIVTAGLVVEPPAVPGLALSADYWRIRIANAIQALGPAAILTSCYERGVDASCDRVHRDPYSHQIQPLDASLQNVGSLTTAGVDVAVAYAARVPGLGELRGGLEAQYLLAYDLDDALTVTHGRGNYDLGVLPRLKGQATARWTHPGGASAGASVRMVGGYLECEANDCSDPARRAHLAREVSAYGKLDLFGGYAVSTRAGITTLQIGVNNALDASPPVVYNAPAANADPSVYDFLGRMVYVRMTQQL